MDADGYIVLMRCPERRWRMYEPTSYGVGREPEPDILLRRGRATVFGTAAAARLAIERTLSRGLAKGATWAKLDGLYQIVPCSFDLGTMAPAARPCLPPHDDDDDVDD